MITAEAALLGVGGAIAVMGCFAPMIISLTERWHGRHRQARAAVQGDPSDGPGAKGYTSRAFKEAAFRALHAASAAGRAGEGLTVAKTARVIGPTCGLCGSLSAGPSGMCSACEAQLVPRGTVGGFAGPGGIAAAVCGCGASYTTPGPRCPSCSAMYMQAIQAMRTLGQATIGVSTTASPASEPLPKDDARRVDLIGWRIWRVTALGYLKAITAEAVYLPGQPMVSHKEIGDRQDSGSGVHVFKDMSGAAREIDEYTKQARDAYAIGTVQLWGEVVEHERGYRAERAMIRSIDGVALPGKSPWDSEPTKALAFLRERYGVGAHSKAPVGEDDNGVEPREV